MPLIDRFASQLDSEHTRRAYVHDLQQFFQFLGRSPSDPTEWTRVEGGALQDFVDEMEETDQSLSTQRRRISAIRQFSAWLRKRGLIDHSPFPDSITFRTAESTSSSPGEKVLNQEQIQSILDTMDPDTPMECRDYALVLVILFAALRRAEAAALNVSDVRPLSRHWVVDLSESGTGQGGYVPIPDEVADTVQSLVDVYEDAQGPLWRSFSPQNRGERLSPDALYKAVRRAGDRAGVEGVTIETLRQSGLRLASMRGATVEELRRHARLQNAASAARYCSADESSRLSNTVGSRITLDL